jgi:glycosyltransferase involved in cell wall biosynthesis
VQRLKRVNILVLCHDVVGKKMAGPGIRYENIYNTLKKEFRVNLGMLGSGKNNTETIFINPAGDSFKKVFDTFDVIFSQWLSDEMIEYAKSKNITLIFDLYAPVPIEYLASKEFANKKLGEIDDLEFSNILDMYSRYFENGDFFLCSNDRQLDFWIGYITALKKIKPSNFGKKNILDSIALGPMGINDMPSGNEDLLMRKKLGLSKDDFILLWSGGIWDWFDAQIIIKAINNINDPNIKLVFMGTKHPNDSVKEMNESILARSLASKLQLVNKSVYFLDGWVAYEDVPKYIKDADACIYCDKASIETRFSHRTRVLDSIRSNVPTICSSGDYFSDIIQRFEMGIVAMNRTEDDFANAIMKLKNSPELKKKIVMNIEKNKSQFSWESTLRPLVEFIQQLEMDGPRTKSRKDSETKNVDFEKIKIKPKVKKRLKNSIKVLLGKIDV